MLRNSREAIAVFPRPYFMLLLLFTVAKRLVREPCDHTSINLQTARHSCMQKTGLPLSTLRRRDEPSAVRVWCREPCRLVSRTSPLGKRKQLTAKQMLHCGTILVVTALHGAVESFKVLTLTSQPRRGQSRLQCGRVAAALLPQFSRFCTENDAIADVAHWPSHIPVAEAPVCLHSRRNIERIVVGFGQLGESFQLDPEPMPIVSVREGCQLSHGWVRVL